MPLAIAAFYAGLFGIIIVVLACNVTLHRFRSRVMLGDGGNVELRRMARIHGNAFEMCRSCSCCEVIRPNDWKPIELYRE
jgi:uncharacterized membrane protein YecN with MAPEG domain